MEVQSTTTVSERESKYRAYNEALYHASTCTDMECTFADNRCRKIKSSLDHFNRCYGPRKKTSALEACESCAKIWGLLCFHAQYCATSLQSKCVVPQCDYLRAKIASKSQVEAMELAGARDRLVADGRNVSTEMQEWSFEKRAEAAEYARQETMNMIASFYNQQ